MPPGRFVSPRAYHHLRVASQAHLRDRVGEVPLLGARTLGGKSGNTLKATYSEACELNGENQGGLAPKGRDAASLSLGKHGKGDADTYQVPALNSTYCVPRAPWALSKWMVPFLLGPRWTRSLRGGGFCYPPHTSP